MGGWLVAEALRQLRFSGSNIVIDRSENVVLGAPFDCPEVAACIDERGFALDLRVIGRAARVLHAFALHPFSPNRLRRNLINWC